jgi:hypothetical protein
MTLSERIALHAARAGWPVCATCTLRHNGAAWSPIVGWHDHASAAPTGSGRMLDDLIPQSPFTRRALAGQLPAKDRTAY